MTCLELPRDLVLRRLSRLHMLGDPPVQGSQKVNKPQSAQGPNFRRPTCLKLPGELISRRLSRLSLPEDLHPDPGVPGSPVATVLGRISFRKTHP